MVGAVVSHAAFLWKMQRAGATVKSGLVALLGQGALLL